MVQPHAQIDGVPAPEVPADQLMVQSTQELLVDDSSMEQPTQWMVWHVMMDPLAQDQVPTQE